MSSPLYVYQRRRWVGAGRHECVAEKGIVASKYPLIGEVGLEMLRKGGNAVDAGVAAAFMDTVVEPAMNGLGGEGVMAIHLASGRNVLVDYVGRPAQCCHDRMFELLEGYETSGWRWR
jgi:gamma-glutamyltranspeptidase/glutathione hydrolase